MPGVIFLVLSSRFIFMMLYSRFMFQVLDSWFHMFQVDIPGFIFQVLYSRLGTGLLKLGEPTGRSRGNPRGLGAALPPSLRI